MKEKQITLYNMVKAYFRNRPTPSITELTNQVDLLANMLFKDVLSNKELNDIIENYEINIGIKAFEPESLISPTINSKWFEEKKNQINPKLLVCRY